MMIGGIRKYETSVCGTAKGILVHSTCCFKMSTLFLVAAPMNFWMEMYDASNKLNVYSIIYSIDFK